MPKIFAIMAFLGLTAPPLFAQGPGGPLQVNRRFFLRGITATASTALTSPSLCAQLLTSSAGGPTAAEALMAEVLQQSRQEGRHIILSFLYARTEEHFRHRYQTDYESHLRFMRGEIPEDSLVRFKEWASDIVAIEDKLSRHFGIPLERIHLERDDFFFPMGNRDHWIENGAPDPRPNPLSVEVHKYFHEELSRLQPDLGVLLNELFERSLKMEGSRFHPGPVEGLYRQFFGRRLSLTKHEMGELLFNSQSIYSEALAIDEPLITGTQEELQLRRLLSWLGRKRGHKIEIPKQEEAVLTASESEPSLVEQYPKADSQ